MSEFKPSDTRIETQMNCKANDALQDSVEKDLSVEDPSKERAKAILSGEANESTKGNDGRTSPSDDTEGSPKGSA